MRLAKIVAITVLFGAFLVDGGPFAPARIARAATTTTFSFTGAAETFTVPAGVTSVRIKARGAQGGRTIRYGMPDSQGGLGGQLIVNIAVVPGDVLTVQVGGTGADNQTRTATGNGGYVIAGGWPDGGNGYSKPSYGEGAGGGGSTRVHKRINGVDTLVLVTAGGGGASMNDEGGAGGRPGTLAGEQGGLPGVPFDGGTRPAGATQSAGGAGGCIDADSNGSMETCAGSGSSLAGGTNEEPLVGDAYGGAGGGGGYFGGGAGSFHSSGGGGSSWYDAALTAFVDDSAVSATGHGTVELLYTVVTCEAGTYGTDGKAPCAPARLGRFVAGTGASSDTAAPAGSFVNSTGAQSATLCAPGSYQPDPGKTSCVLASVNHYVAGPGATSQTPCAVGYEAGSTGSTACTASAAAAPPQTTSPNTTTAPTTSLQTPPAPRVATKVGVRKSFLVSAKNQRNSTGQKVTLTSSSGVCRVTGSSKGFTVTGVRKGTCTLVMKVTGDARYGSLRRTTVVRVA